VHHLAEVAKPVHQTCVKNAEKTESAHQNVLVEKVSMKLRMPKGKMYARNVLIDAKLVYLKKNVLTAQETELAQEYVIVQQRLMIPDYKYVHLVEMLALNVHLMELVPSVVLSEEKHQIVYVNLIITKLLLKENKFVLLVM